MTSTDDTERGDSTGAKGQVEQVALDRQQAAFARRMAESKATAPHFYLGVEVEMSEALAVRDGADATINDLLLRAAALALAEVPRVNGAYRDGQVEIYSQINLSFAVAGSASVVFPTIFEADRKPLDEIATETKLLAGKARNGTITAPEFSGGTFTVTNLGMHGVDRYTPILNPPQAATLGASMVKERPVAHSDGVVESRATLPLDLACDHRILTGPDAASFLGCLRAHLEDPSSL
jgi:pyruvate dehydrogenase E2 component (dihydrolipoamide acetyltransferase)